MSAPATEEFELRGRPAQGPERDRPAGGRRWRPSAQAPWLRYAGLPAAMAVAALLDLRRLSQNGYANIFYSAAVHSMLHSLHDLLFVSFDQGGLISVDKPPLALWVQVASAKLFGFAPMSLLLPGAIEGILAVGLLYVVLVRPFGAPAAFVGAVATAIFPAFVAVARANGVDALLILLMLAACGACLRACESGRMRWVLATALLVGLAFNTKTLAAYIALPGIALGYLLCAPVSWRRRVLHLLAGGILAGAVSFGWIAFVELTPASQRPYVGSSSNNTELGLTFEYNGFGRVEGQRGGPNTIKPVPGAQVPPAKILFPYPPGTRKARETVLALERQQKQQARTQRERRQRGLPALAPLPGGRERNPIPFGGPPGPLRLFGKGLGDQGGWLLPFALVGLLAVLALLALERLRGPAAGSTDAEATIGAGAEATIDGAGLAPAARAASNGVPIDAGAGAPQRARPVRRGTAGSATDAVLPARGWAGIRRDPRFVAAVVLGGWLLAEVVVLSASKGIVHPYYTSALAPATGAMIGGGAGAIAAMARRGPRWLACALLALALATTAAVQTVEMHKAHYMLAYVPVLLACCGACVLAAALVRRASLPAIALSLAAIAIVPAAYASTTWLAPVEATFPAAGPKRADGTGGVGVDSEDMAIDRALMRYVRGHDPGTRWELLTVASDTAAPMMLMGLKAGALAGYSGTDPALSARGLARLVRLHQARYVLLGGDYSNRGGNGATKGVLRACRQLRSGEWKSPLVYPNGLVLFDCAGHEAALEAATSS